MYRDSLIFIVVIISVLVTAIPQPALTQPSMQHANLLLQNGWNALRAGYDLEASGRIDAALNAYQEASRSASDSLRIGDRHHIPFPRRPGGVYFLYGQANLALAQAFIVQRRPMDQIFNALSEAENAFTDTLKLSDLNTFQRDRRWAGRRTEALFALGTVFFLQGRDQAARNVMLDILNNFDPNHAPAIDTLMAVDYARGQRQDRFTSTGKRLPERPRGKASKSRSMEYIVEIGKALFGRWGTVVGMLVEDVFGTN